MLGMSDNKATRLMYCDNRTFVLACMINISSGCRVSLNNDDAVVPKTRLVVVLLVKTLMANIPMICCAANKLHNKPIQLMTTPIVIAR